MFRKVLFTFLFSKKACKVCLSYIKSSKQTVLDLAEIKTIDFLCPLKTKKCPFYKNRTLPSFSRLVSDTTQFLTLLILNNFGSNYEACSPANSIFKTNKCKSIPFTVYGRDIFSEKFKITFNLFTAIILNTCAQESNILRLGSIITYKKSLF